VYLGACAFKVLRLPFVLNVHDRLVILEKHIMGKEKELVLFGGEG